MVDYRSMQPGDLMKRAKDGDQAAFGALYDLYYVPVFRYVYIRTKNRHDSEDIAQTVFIKAYGAIHRYVDKNKAPLAYFFTIARTTLIDHWRKQKPSMSIEEMSSEPVAPDSPHDFALAQEASFLIHKHMDALSDEQRDAITLKFIEGYSTREIADILEKSEEAVRQLQSRGLRILRTTMKNHEESI